METLAVVSESDEGPFVFDIVETAQVEAGETEDVLDDPEYRFDCTLSTLVSGFGIVGLHLLLHTPPPRCLGLGRRLGFRVGRTEIVNPPLLRPRHQPLRLRRRGLVRWLRGPATTVAGLVGTPLVLVIGLLDQPAFRWTHLNADKLIYFKDLEHLICVR